MRKMGEALACPMPGARPRVSASAARGRSTTAKPSPALAIEPMLMAGGHDDYRTGTDGWTLHTIDGSRAAHIEHTVTITEAGARILTCPDPDSEPSQR